MKEKDAYIDFDGHRVTVFVEKEDGAYGAMETGSYLASNYLDDFWQKMQHFHKNACEQLVSNKISPVAFYLIMKEMAPADAAARVGISTAAVKKHMQPAHFGDMKLSTALRYAEVFGIPLANLFQVTPEFSIQAPVKQKKSFNPFVVTIES